MKRVGDARTEAQARPSRTAAAPSGGRSAVGAAACFPITFQLLQTGMILGSDESGHRVTLPLDEEDANLFVRDPVDDLGKLAVQLRNLHGLGWWIWRGCIVPIWHQNSRFKVLKP